MASHHDSIFHRTFADPANAAAMFMAVLPPPLVRAIDWSTLTQHSTKLTDAKLRNHYPDLYYSVRLREHPLVLILLPEHKSEDDSGFVLQVLRYALVVWEIWSAEHPDSDGLPPIIPVLFHHGDQPWHSPTSILGHLDLGGLADVRTANPELAACISASGVSLAACALDMGSHDEDWLRASTFPDLAKLIMLCMRFLRFQGPDDALATLDRWRDLVRAVHLAPRGQMGMAGVESYLFEATDLTPEQVREALARAMNQDPGDTIMTTAERLRKEGEARGEALGRKQHAIETTLLLLDQRFGPLPADVVSRVQNAPLPDLDRWTANTLAAKTLAEVFRQG